MDIKFSGSDANGFQFDQNAAPKPKRERKPRKSIGSKGGRIAVNVLVTLLGGAVYAALSPMTLREGLAISAGFGWYTMAPSVIASAGHTMASAVSFLHNVLREMLGIILLPVIAGKIGYIEAITIPGTASTDVCLPIVEQVCNSETVAYSFCTGMLMCITSAALVPIIIGA